MKYVVLAQGSYDIITTPGEFISLHFNCGTGRAAFRSVGAEIRRTLEES